MIFLGVEPSAKSGASIRLHRPADAVGRDPGPRVPLAAWLSAPRLRPPAVPLCLGAAQSAVPRHQLPNPAAQNKIRRRRLIKIKCIYLYTKRELHLVFIKN